MTSKQQHTNPRENFKKNFFWKISSRGCLKYAYIRNGDSPPILFTFENFAPQISPFLLFFRFCTFLWAFSESRARSSDYAQNFIPFRTNPIMYNNLYIFGFCARVPCFSIFAYIGTGAGAGVYSDFVFILFIFGNIIQKSLFVYYCRKEV